MTTGRPIDHLVIASRNLDRLAAQYQALGFTLTPRAYHEDRMGTSNRLAQFRGKTFLELLEVDRPETVQPPAPGGFAFGDFLKRYVGAQEGMAMIVFRTDDARADIADWQAKGLDTYEPFDFERQATLPDSSTVTVSFSLGFVTSPDMPDLGFFVCQNRAPEHFWKPDFQTHDNGAEDIESVVIATDDPSREAGFLSALFGGAITLNGFSLSVACGAHRIDLVKPERLAEYGWQGNTRTGPVAAGMQIRSSTGRTDRVQEDQAGGSFIQWIQ